MTDRLGQSEASRARLLEALRNEALLTAAQAEVALAVFSREVPEVSDEMVTRAAEAMEDAAVRWLGRDLGTTRRNDIARAALDAALSGDGLTAGALLGGDASDAYEFGWEQGYAAALKDVQNDVRHRMS